MKPCRLLLPFSVLFGLLIKIRQALYRRNFFRSIKIDLPVICVGNVVAGGSGKSPFVQYLTNHLTKSGFSPVILLRGHGGRVKGPHLVNNSDNPESVGDEAVMHFQSLGNSLKVVVARDRVEGAEYIQNNKLADIIVMDDGFQHFALKRDLNILLLDISNEESIKKWRNGSLLPAGYLREPLTDALFRADCVLLVDRLNASKEKTAPTLSRPTFILNIQPAFLVDAKGGEQYPTSWLKNKSLSVITAIANPEQFLTNIKTLGGKIEHSASYPDHYLFSETDWKNVLKHDLPVVATAKDATKLSKHVIKSGELFILEITSSLGAEDEKQLDDLIAKITNKKKV